MPFRSSIVCSLVSQLFHLPDGEADMSQDHGPADHGVHTTVLRLTESLRSYVEAQYHIRNESLIRERRCLLEEPGAVAQVPFVESTPVYELGKHYSALQIPQVAKDALKSLGDQKLGLF